MKTRQVLMTPEWALSLLELNTENRPLNAKRVADLARAITRGEWLLSHQGVAVSFDNVLLDGQHRLSAIVAAGKPVPILLSEQCNPETFKVVDTGIKRQAGHVLGIESVPNAAQTATSCRFAMAYERLPRIAWNGSALTFSNADIVGWYSARSTSIDLAVRRGLNGKNRFSVIRATPLSVFCYLAAQAGWDESVDDFLSELCDGAGLRNDSPVFAFRRVLINKSVSLLAENSYRSTQATIASLILVFNNWTEGRSMKLFRLSAYVPMPKIFAQ